MLRTPCRGLLLGLGILSLVLAPSPAPAQPRLTGDWGGFRDRMAKRGVALDVDWLQTLQGVMSGGKDQDAGYWGTFEYTERVALRHDPGNTAALLLQNPCAFERNAP